MTLTRCRHVAVASIMLLPLVAAGIATAHAMEPMSGSKPAPHYMAADPSALPAVIGGSPGRDNRTGRNVDVYRHFDINRRTTINRDPNVNRDTNLDRNLNRNLNLNQGIGTTFVLKPYRPWVKQSYYGKVVSGVTLGTIVGVTSTPVPPSTKVCWFWATSSHTQGYWDFCR